MLLSFSLACQKRLGSWYARSLSSSDSDLSACVARTGRQKRNGKRAPLIPHMSDDFHTHSLFFVTPPSSRHTDKKFIASLL